MKAYKYSIVYSDEEQQKEHERRIKRGECLFERYWLKDVPRLTGKRRLLIWETIK